MGPHVTIVIPTRNRAKLLGEALNSVSGACDGISYEVIVADGGSVDDTSAVVGAAGAVLVAAGGVGASFGRNAGARAATGDYIAFLDDDDLLTPDSVSARARFLDDHPEFDAVVAQAVSVDERVTSRSRPWPDGLPTDGDLRRSFVSYYPQIGATMVRASSWPQVGLFDVTLFNSQDWDWHLRLATACKVGFLPTPAVLFRLRPDGTSDEQEWKRLRSAKLVLSRTAARMGNGAPRRLRVRRRIEIAGDFHAYFARSAVVHLSRGNRRAASRSLARSIVASPLHSFADCLRPTAFRSALVHVPLSWRRRAGERDLPSAVST